MGVATVVPITLHSWRRKDPKTRRWRVLGWKMTADQAKDWAAKEGVELEMVDGSAETREPIATGWGSSVGARGATFFHAHCTEAIVRHFDDFGAKGPDDE